VKPLVYSDQGHLDGKVTVTLETGSYGEDGRCSGVYCHGGTFTDTSAKNTRPLWNGGASEAVCGSCHGLAPSSHARSNCADCHPKTLPDARHVDGRISLGDESGTCGACHTIDPAKLSGAHLGHLTAPLKLRAPLGCVDCHKNPAVATDPRHPDTARAECTTHCHGANVPAWTDPPSAAYCGTCHPFTPASHDANLKLSDCSACHPSTMDATGAFLMGGAHINGVVDAQ
jgi:predicted CxxxxCH...CXXCH cytochrome family protein